MPLSNERIAELIEYYEGVLMQLMHRMTADDDRRDAIADAVVFVVDTITALEQLQPPDLRDPMKVLDRGRQIEMEHQATLIARSNACSKTKQN
jgi:hypothetical protein